MIDHGFLERISFTVAYFAIYVCHQLHVKGYTELLSWVQYISNSWDEWVGEERLMKHTEENVTKQLALDKKQNVDKNVKSGRSSQAKAKSSTGK